MEFYVFVPAASAKTTYSCEIAKNCELNNPWYLKAETYLGVWFQRYLVFLLCMPSKAALQGVFYGQVTRTDCKLEVLAADGRWQEHLHGNFWCVHMCSRRALRPVISVGGGVAPAELNQVRDTCGRALPQTLPALHQTALMTALVYIAL